MPLAPCYPFLFSLLRPCLKPCPSPAPNPYPAWQRAEPSTAAEPQGACDTHRRTSPSHTFCHVSPARTPPAHLPITSPASQCAEPLTASGTGRACDTNCRPIPHLRGHLPLVSLPQPFPCLVMLCDTRLPAPLLNSLLIICLTTYPALQHAEPPTADDPGGACGSHPP